MQLANPQSISKVSKYRERTGMGTESLSPASLTERASLSPLSNLVRSARLLRRNGVSKKAVEFFLL